MKDERLGDEATSFFSVCLGAILLVILVALAVYGHVRKTHIENNYIYDRTNPEELGGFVGVAECDLSCTVI